ncbi:MAG: putative transposase [Rhodothermales bacterium]
MSPAERREVLDTLHDDRFIDDTPATVAAKLLDDGKYLFSVRTMYRILNSQEEVAERRKIRRATSYSKPQLVAKSPNEVWSWDITKIKGPFKWTYFYLYVIIDIFSRYVVGWLLATNESQDLATRLISETCKRQQIAPSDLTLHADRGIAMTSKAVSSLLVDLGIERSHSRPRISNDNPYSESQFKTMKYHHNFPDHFTDQPTGRAHCRDFLSWYNTEHRHSGIAYLSPADVHFGRTGKLLAVRQQALDAVYAHTPWRFSHDIGRYPRSGST